MADESVIWQAEDGRRLRLNAESNAIVAEDANGPINGAMRVFPCGWPTDTDMARFDAAVREAKAWLDGLATARPALIARARAVIAEAK